MTLRRKGGKRFPHRRNPDYKQWITGQRCIVVACDRPGEPAHVVAEGAGGDDRGKLLPLCAKHHRTSAASFHQLGIRSFERVYHLKLQDVAQGYLERYESGVRP